MKEVQGCGPVGDASVRRVLLKGVDDRYFIQDGDVLFRPRGSTNTAAHVDGMRERAVLIVHDKVTGISLPIQVKSRTVTSKKPRGVVQFNLRLETFNDRFGSHVLAILLDTHKGQIDRAWLIPMSELPDIAHVKKGYVIQPSPKLTSKDRYAPYRCQDMREVTDRLLAFLDAPPPSG